MTTMVVNNTLNKLIEIGFSEYEARAYMALIGNNPVTAYEIARLSGIPTSKIYEVLARLEDKGVVSFSSVDSKKMYVPLPPQEFIESHRSRLESTLDTLKRELSAEYIEKDVSYIWNLHDYDHLMEKAERMILKAETNILLSGWKEDILPLGDCIKDKTKRGIPVAIVNFGETAIGSGQVFRHPIEDTIYDEKGGRGFTLVADSREAMTATVYRDRRVEGAWSMNSGFVTLAEDYVKHDIYIMKIVERFDKELIKRFGAGYVKLRDVFHDEEAT
ncbi:MAG: hypothetical protein CVV44_08000 [Spirochaetae bacterium HGW-Spirochaetae-1]|nr:MAG: hypothetical protein CVV44_08000 [Spirochaetae bacterium HGW-Spirochaetae-1]